MKQNINLVYVNTPEQFETINELYKKPEINKTFDGYRTDRIICSQYSFLIYLDETPIGFILIVQEEKFKTELSIDIAILEKYRKNGYAKQAIIQFKSIFIPQIEEDLIAEVKQNNIPANKLIKSLRVQQQNTTNNTNVYKILK